jgi:hypothetical protein
MIIGDFFRLHGAYPSKISDGKMQEKFLGIKKGYHF